MIPARLGSTRLKMKNLALLDGRPLISYAIRAAQESGVFDRVVVNSDHARFLEIAKRYGAEFYPRPEDLGSSTTKSDTVVKDFIAKNSCDILVWVNPISPLQESQEVRDAVTYFRDSDLDTLITVQEHHLHSVLDGNPLNFSPNEEFAQTQHLMPVQTFVYSLMMWKSASFSAAMASRGHAILCGKVGYYPVGKLSSIIIKTDEDLMIAEALIQLRKHDYSLRYDPIAGLEEG